MVGHFGEGYYGGTPLEYPPDMDLLHFGVGRNTISAHVSDLVGMHGAGGCKDITGFTSRCKLEFVVPSPFISF